MWKYVPFRNITNTCLLNSVETKSVECMLLVVYGVHLINYKWNYYFLLLTFVSKFGSFCISCYVIEYICQFLHDINIPKGARAARAHCVLIVKKLNKCTLSFLVYNLFLDRQRIVSIHRYLSCLHEIHV